MSAAIFRLTSTAHSSNYRGRILGKAGFGPQIMKYQQEKALATRNQVMQAALKVFCRKGYSATTLADVAEEARLSRGAIYWNFNNKQDLYVTLVREYFQERIHGVLVARSAQLSDPLSALREYMFNYNYNTVANSEIREFMELVRYKTEVKTLSEDILSVQRKFDILMKEEISDLIKLCRDSGSIRVDIPEDVLVMATLSYLNGIESTWMFNQEIFPLEKHLRTLIDIFVDSILKPQYI